MVNRRTLRPTVVCRLPARELGGRIWLVFAVLRDLSVVRALSAWVGKGSRQSRRLEMVGDRGRDNHLLVACARPGRNSPVLSRMSGGRSERQERDDASGVEKSSGLSPHSRMRAKRSGVSGSVRRSFAARAQAPESETPRIREGQFFARRRPEESHRRARGASVFAEGVQGPAARRAGRDHSQCP